MAYALGSAPTRLTSDWPTYNAQAGALLELIYYVPGGTAAIDTNQVKRVLGARPGVSVDWVRKENANQVRARIRMTEPGRLGSVLGRYLRERDSELELRVVEPMGQLSAPATAAVRTVDRLATAADDTAYRAAKVTGGVVNAVGNAAGGILSGARVWVPLGLISAGLLYTFMKSGGQLPRRRRARSR